MSPLARAAALLLLLTGCPSDEPVDPGDPTPAPTEPDDSWIATLPELMLEPQVDQHGGIGTSFDATLRDPVTAWADCAALVSDCLHETDGDFDGCVAAPPTCATDEPWTEAACCPATCKTAFTESRGAGSSPYDAYVRVFALDATCFPGVEARR